MSDNDYDLAPLIPSNGSSFNLSGDAEYLSNSFRGKSNKSSSNKSGQISNQRRRSINSTGSNNKKKQLGHQHSTLSSRSHSSVTDNTQKGHPPEQDNTAYFHHTGVSAKLSPIAGSSSFHSVEAGESTRSKNSNTKSPRSEHRTGMSSNLPRKERREEKRKKWLKRWRRRRFIGTIVLSFIYTLLFAYTVLITAGPLVLNYWIDPIEWCPSYLEEFGENSLLQKTSKDVHEDLIQEKDETSTKYENPDYNYSPCHITRIPLLLHLTLEECDLSRRMALSVILGGLIGSERRASDRPAGIRTMALVSLGSCFFTISSMLAFRASPMGWDSSRVSAAIPSGVGFLGAGLIWKGTLKDGSGTELYQVHGITTAASVWLSAAVGVGAGGALYAVSAYSTALVVLVLRFGPRLYLASDRGFEDDEEEFTDYEDEYEKESERHPDQSQNTVDSEGRRRQDTAALKTHETEGYGATTNIEEEHLVAHLLQAEQQRQIERLNSRSQALKNHLGDSDSHPFAWLTKMLSGQGKQRQQPHNPYQEIYNDREVMRMIKKKKSMSSMKSRPSFCT